jgi:hypothetical protein
MINRKLVEEIISIYTKHGWKPGRVLLSEDSRATLGEDSLGSLFQGAEVVRAGFDAVWFERASRKGSTAIELRHLGEAPFALFELVGEENPSEEIRKELENRMADYASKAATAKDH